MIPGSSTIFKLLRVLRVNSRQFSQACRTKIDPKTREEFTNFALNSKINPYSRYQEASIEAGTILKTILPDKHRKIMEEFANKSRSVILLDNSPITKNNEIPPTPSNTKIHL